MGTVFQAAVGGRKSREGKGTSGERDRDPGVGGKGKTIL